MGPRRVAAAAAQLAIPPSRRSFAEADLRQLPSPVRRYLTEAIGPGVALASSCSLRMHGKIKIGRWMPFRAREVLAPHRGYVWPARVAGLVIGEDRYLNGVGSMRWKLGGVLSVALAEGPDVSRSAAGRAGGEAVWLPTSLLPEFGVSWSARDEHQIRAQFRVDETPVDLHIELLQDGRPRSVAFERWGDPDQTGSWDWHRSGGEFTAYKTFHGLTIPSEGRFGWFYGTDRWTAGDFFHYQITDLRPTPRIP